MTNPDVPDRALPAAWRLLRAADLGTNPDRPCKLAPYAGECAEHGGSWDGPGADELRHAAGVTCLSQIVDRVIEAEQTADLTPMPPAVEQVTLSRLWAAMEQNTPQAEMLRQAMLRTLLLVGNRDGQAHVWKPYVEDLVTRDRGAR